MNRNQIITLIVGVILAFVAGQLNIGVPAADIQNGIVSAVLLAIALFAHDANGETSILSSKSAIAGIVGSLFWLITTVFKVNVGATVQQSVMGFILMMQGYYTLNHSSIVHEVAGTVGVASPGTPAAGN